MLFSRVRLTLLYKGTVMTVPRNQVSKTTNFRRNGTSHPKLRHCEAAGRGNLLVDRADQNRPAGDCHVASLLAMTCMFGGWSFCFCATVIVTGRQFCELSGRLIIAPTSCFDNHHARAHEFYSSVDMCLGRALHAKKGPRRMPGTLLLGIMPEYDRGR